MLGVIFVAWTALSSIVGDWPTAFTRTFAIRVTPVGTEIFTGHGAAGTAFFVGKRHAVTAYHVVDDWAIWSIRSYRQDGTVQHWKVAAAERAHDIALLQAVDGPDAPAVTPVAQVPLGYEIPLGEEVCAVTMYPHRRIVCGRVQPRQYGPRTLIFDGIVTPGNSGSPVYWRGAAIGVLSALVACGSTPCLGVVKLF